ncbi:MAG: cyclic nucleotide-binding domain-containing protein [Thermodesulfovibrionia bacterium]|nr:cyclic nucleotide-binding domain-containing protein [Thermodesulfovibrionia bacterium]
MRLLASDFRRYNYFSSLSDNSLELLSKKSKVVNFPAGSVILKEGDAGDFFYFIKQGQVEVTKRTKSGQDAILSVIGSGQGFGEIALLTCPVRSSSVRAITDVTLFELPKAEFENIVLDEAAFNISLTKNVEGYLRFNRIKILQPFQLLEPFKMFAIMEKMAEKQYAPGEDIIVQGEKGEHYYIIESGRVAVLKSKKGGEEYQQVAVLDAGEAFGEEALIRDDPRNATCRAIEKTTVAALHKKDFNQIMKPSFLDNIFPEDVPLDRYLDEYVIIDARVPAEYEEAHIYGAINIPLEILRQESIDFDKSKKYITYCLNDSRGMVAAFLLKNHGFHSQCLRGGVNGWEGEIVTGSNGIHLPGGKVET